MDSFAAYTALSMLLCFTWSSRLLQRELHSSFLSCREYYYSYTGRWFPFWHLHCFAHINRACCAQLDVVAESARGKPRNTRVYLFLSASLPVLLPPTQVPPRLFVLSLGCAFPWAACCRTVCINQPGVQHGPPCKEAYSHPPRC